MVTVVECGTQADIRDEQSGIEIRTCRSVGVQVQEGDFALRTDESKINKYGNGSPVFQHASLSTEVVIEEGDERPPEYRCDYCCGCLLCDRGHAWYSLHGKACPWVLLLTPVYLVLGVVLLPFFVLMGIAYCVAAAME